MRKLLKVNTLHYICVYLHNTDTKYTHVYPTWGTRWSSWLRHCATSRKVTGSIPDGLIGIFH